jgi:hypothetical protein
MNISGGNEGEGSRSRSSLCRGWLSRLRGSRKLFRSVNGGKCGRRFLIVSRGRGVRAR